MDLHVAYFDLRDRQKFRYSIVESWFCINDFREKSKRNLYPLRHYMHIGEVVYNNILQRLAVENRIQQHYNAVCCCIVY